MNDNDFELKSTNMGLRTRLYRMAGWFALFLPIYLNADPIPS